MSCATENDCSNAACKGREDNRLQPCCVDGQCECVLDCAEAKRLAGDPSAPNGQGLPGNQGTQGLAKNVLKYALALLLAILLSITALTLLFH